jgi:hypothetical protein
MPNGSPDFEQNIKPELDTFFGQFAPVLEAFADRHNLHLVRYYHQLPSWDFLFRHPLGGVGKIEPWKEGPALEVRWYWWIDRYEEQTRQSRQGGPVVVDAEGERLGEVLVGALREVASWEHDAWDDVTQYPSWGSVPREVVEAADRNYPLPRL